MAEGPGAKLAFFFFRVIMLGDVVFGAKYIAKHDEDTRPDS